MSNLIIEYYEGLSKVETTNLKEWFRNFFGVNHFCLIEEPKVLVSCAIGKKIYTIQVFISGDNLNLYLIFYKNKMCLDKRYISQDYSNVDKIFIELLVKLKKSVKMENYGDEFNFG